MNLTYIRIFSGILLIIVLSTGSCIKDLNNTNENADYVVKLFGGAPIDKGYGITTCPDDGYAIAGTMKTSPYMNQAVLIRTDKYGDNLPWSPMFINDTTSTYAYHLLATSDGEFLITGSILKKETGINNFDVMIAKVKADGKLAWQRSYGGNDNDEGYCAIELTDGSFMIGGYTSSIGNGKKDAYILKLNNNGSLIKSFTYGGLEDDECRQIIDLGDALVIIGSTNSFQFSTQSISIIKIESGSGGIIDNAWYGGAYNYTAVKAISGSNQDITILSNFTNLNSNTSGIYLLKINPSNIHQIILEKTIEKNLTDIRGNDLLMKDNRLIILGTSTYSQDSDVFIDILNASWNVINPDNQTLKVAGNQSAMSGCLVGSGKKIAVTGANADGENTKIMLLKTDLPD